MDPCLAIAVVLFFGCIGLVLLLLHLLVRRRQAEREACPRCRAVFNTEMPRCPSCGLEPRSALGLELRDLEAAARQIQVLTDRGLLAADTAEAVYRSIESRQNDLLDTGRSEPAADASPRSLLERLLAAHPQVRDLPPDRCRAALAWFRKLAPEEADALSPPALLGLARLLRTAGFASRSLHAYETLVARHPSAPAAAEGAPEAIHFATMEGKLPSRGLLHFAESLPLAPETRNEVGYLLSTADPAEAVPVEAALPTDVIQVIPLGPEPTSETVPKQGESLPVVEAGPGVLPPPLPVEPISPQPSPPPELQRSWGRMLAGFMEERNILWGELVGGLLIVGCSIALVLSLWRTLERIPYFPFAVFAGLTLALFGAGLYTLSHWKLEATSRGLLAIAALLTPLNFLVLAGLAPVQAAGWLDWSTLLLALLLFGFMTHRAGKILFAALGRGSPPDASAAWLLVLGLVGASATLMPTPRWLDQAAPTPWLFALLSLTPVVVQGIALGILMVRIEKAAEPSPARTHQTLGFLGLTTFAVAVALGFIVFNHEDTAAALRLLALPVTLAALPLVALGTQAASGSRDEGGKAEAGPVSMIAAGVVLAGVALLLLAAAGAWPRPLALSLIGWIDGLVLGLLAWRYAQPGLLAFALGGLTLGILLVFHGLGSSFAEPPSGEDLAALLTSGVSGAVLTVLACLSLLCGEGCARLNRSREGQVFAGAAALLAVAALVLATVHPQAVRSTLVFTLVGVATLIAAGRRRQPGLTLLASLILLGALIHAGYLPDVEPNFLRILIAALTIHGTLSLAGAWLWERCLYAAEGEQEGSTWREGLIEPLRILGLLTSAGALLLLPAILSWDVLPWTAAVAAWVAVLWTGAALDRRSAALLAAAQIASLAAALLGTCSFLAERPWVERVPECLLEPPSLQVHLVGLALLALFWAAARWLPVRRLRDLLAGERLSCDEILVRLLWVGQVGLATAAVVPEVLRESWLPVRPPPEALPFHPHASWLLLGVLILDWLVRWVRAGRIGWAPLFLGTTGALLLAHGFAEQRAAASALTWTLGLGFLAASVLWWSRNGLARFWERAGWGGLPSEEGWRWGRVGLLLAALPPVLLVASLQILPAFQGDLTAGPLPASVFANLGRPWTVAIPLMLVVLGLAGHGVREDRAYHLQVAGFLAAGTLVGGHALALAVAGITLDATETAYLVQLALLALAVWGLGWLLLPRGQQGWLQGSLALVGAFLFLTLALPALSEILWGGPPWPPYLAQVAAWPSWMGLAGTLAVGLALAARHHPACTLHVLASAGTILGVLIAGAAAPGDPTGWRAYHSLTLAWGLLAVTLLALSWWTEQRLRDVRWLPPVPTRAWTNALGTAVVALAVGGAFGDATRPTWSCGAVLAVAGLFAASALWARRPGYVYLAGFLLNLTAFLLWQAWMVARWGLVVWFAPAPETVERFLLLQVLGLAAGSLIWSLVEIALRRREPPIDLRSGGFPYVHAASLLAVHLLGMLVLVGLTSDVLGLRVRLEDGLLGWAFAATAVALLAAFWDPEGSAYGMPLPALHGLGPIALGLLVHRRELPVADLAMLGTLLLAGYLVLWSGLVLGASFWSRVAHRLDLPPRESGVLAGWFVPVQCWLGALVLGASLGFSLDLLDWDRTWAGPAAVAVLILATVLGWNWKFRGLPAAWPETHLPRLTLVLVALAVAETAWRWLVASAPSLSLQRIALLQAAATGLGGAYLAASFRLAAGGRLQRAAFAVGRGLLILAALALAVVLVQEFFLYDPQTRTTPLLGPLVVLVAVLLAGLVAGALATALLRGNPAGLTDRGRTRCVWLAEGLVVLLLVHLRVNVPDFFSGFLGANWPFLLMGLGFVGVGAAEWCRRRGLHVLAEPLERTGLFLPLVPLAAYLVRPLADFEPLREALPGLQPFLRYLERLPGAYGLQALLWFLLAGLFALVGILKRGRGWGIAAALAADFGLWVILAHREGWAFTLHPQFWLVPLGAIVLAAEALYRDRLTETQARTARHLGLLMIYASSTADMFLAGLGRSVWLPIVLALLAVAGVLAGILLRVRAFLVQGTFFLFLVVVAQIWYAAVDLGRTWVWWASGIVLGAAILALFAVFEKRRQGVPRVLEDLRHWK